MRQEGEPLFKPGDEVSFTSSNSSIVTTSVRYSSCRINKDGKQIIRYLLMGFANEFDENELEANFSKLRTMVLENLKEEKEVEL